MASIRKNPRNGAWEVRYPDATGAQRTRKVEGESRKSDALALKAAIETNLHRGQWRDPALGKVLRRCPRVAGEHPEEKGHDLRPRHHGHPCSSQPGTQRHAVVTGQAFPDQSRGGLEDDRGLAPATVRTNYGVLRAIMAWAVENDVIDRSPCRGGQIALAV